ncbi:RidA family protein [Palleronia sp. KMU-117]|uniref:RidA family protein n=1 Tax=Palleronia sp. KMU-117 TaxID=3434108 RepID=UPI003D7600DA
MERSYVKGDWQQGRAFSPAVITTGPQKIVWVAGHGGLKSDDGTVLKGDFEAQCRQCFRNLERTLDQAGATLKDIVTMTVFVTDVRFTTPMTQIRTEIFGDDFPASAAVTVTGFADPAMLIEIQCIAVME